MKNLAEGHSMKGGAMEGVDDGYEYDPLPEHRFVHDRNKEHQLGVLLMLVIIGVPILLAAIIVMISF